MSAPEEIQVYMDDLSAGGEFGLDLHTNYVPSGRRESQYAGEQAPRHVLRVTPEFYYGVTENIELGLYVLSSMDANNQVHQVGAKLRLKYIAPHDDARGPFWGANVEVGRTARRVSDAPWNVQLKGIFGYRAGAWTYAVNPNLDFNPKKQGGPVILSVDGKVGYSLSARTMVGAELYNDLGRFSKIDSFNRNAKTLFAVVDQQIGSFDVNAGIGRGLTSEADRWVMKLVVGTHF